MAGMSDLNTWDLFLIIWYPHSGCRWLNRGLLSRHSKIVMSEFFCPWLTYSTDMILSLDKTSQVHRTRQNVELSEEFEAVRVSVEFGREQGLRRYFSEKRDRLQKMHPDKKYGGVLPLGSPEALFPDLKLLLRVMPNLRIVHMVRDPSECFLSFKSRGESDGNPFKIGTTWVGINSLIREACSDLQDPHRFFVLRYEDLLKNVEEQLEQLCKWVGVPFEREMLEGVTDDFSRNQDGTGDCRATKEECDILLSIVHGEAKHYGYEKSI